MRTLFLCALVLVAPPSHCGAQPVAVYESEENARSYHGVHQAPLRRWLEERGQAHVRIGDAQAADPLRLARYAVVLASSVYIVPVAARRGLMAYLAQGGHVLWIDSPARCADAAFRAALGFGPDTAYAPLQRCTLTAAQPSHPVSVSVQRFQAASLVGNVATSPAPGAHVLYTMAGRVASGAVVRYPAVMLARYGRGQALAYNWIPWLTEPSSRRPGEPVTGDALALLGDGLDYLLASHGLRNRTRIALCRATPERVAQPGATTAGCRLFQRASARSTPSRWRIELWAHSAKRPCRSASAVASWSHADGRVHVGQASARLHTGGLPDGAYRVICRMEGGGRMEGEAPLVLEGHRLAVQRAQETRRYKMLAGRLRGTLGDYDLEPRTPDGRVDIPRLLNQIVTAHMNTYDWLVWHAATDWEDLQRFLPEAQARGVRVWVTVCPPSEQGGSMPWCEPYRLDFVRWADEVGKLSQRHPNLVAFVIDDFSVGDNAALFTPAYAARVAAALKRRNPGVGFLPTVYLHTIGSHQWLRDYGPSADGIVFPYADLEGWRDLPEQLRACRRWLGPRKLLFVNVYASGSSGPPEKAPRTEEYLRQVLTISRALSDGIRIYCLPKERMLDDYRYAVTAELYRQWRSMPWPAR